MPAKIIILAGAPAPSTVNLSSCVDDIGKASRCFDAEGEFERRDSRPAWRSLSLIRKPLHTGFSLVHDVHDTPFQGSATFFTTADVCVEGSRLPPGSDADAVMAQFFEQTLAEHGTDSSPPPEDSFATDDATSMLTASSADITHTYTDSMPPPPAPPALSDLKDVPAASRIAALQPQTLTLNLIVGVISIAQPRTVTTRWGKPLSLVEVLVGDNTATGFAITFWLSSEDADSSVLKLRRQDVVLVEKVALHVFRDKVYGQSLRRGMTRVSLLWRQDGSGRYSTRSLASKRMAAAERPQQEKARLVKDWVLCFVGRDSGATTRRSLRRSWNRPPDDTQ
ncbi:hypothetical protein RJ55_00903 [Drechmeria coniospora]|nr:hypothetical protein RJ55_00903 [Drechmeria coniospora]